MTRPNCRWERPKTQTSTFRTTRNEHKIRPRKRPKSDRKRESHLKTNRTRTDAQIQTEGDQFQTALDWRTGIPSIFSAPRTDPQNPRNPKILLPTLKTLQTVHRLPRRSFWPETAVPAPTLPHPETGARSPVHHKPTHGPAQARPVRSPVILRRIHVSALFRANATGWTGHAEGPKHREVEVETTSG